MIERAGIQIPDAVRMATYNPAKVIQADDHIGSLEIGKTANIIVFDKDLNIKMTFING